MIFEEIGKSTFVFRVEIPRDKINDAVEDAFERFETTHESYKIRVFKTSENLKRAGTVVEAHFLTIKVEAVNVRISAYAMTPVLNYILLYDFGLRAKDDFEIDAESKTIEMFKSHEILDRKGILKKPLQAHEASA